MRYEPLDLGVLRAVFSALNPGVMEEWVRSESTSIPARRAWYLCELLTGRQLDVPDVPPTGYTDLLNPEIHITGPSVRIRRQRINDNLLGGPGYCPLIRRTEALEKRMNERLAAEARTLVDSCDPQILARAINYLYTRETKSSFAIEGEVPPSDRAGRFVAALRQADSFDPTRAEALIGLQNAALSFGFVFLHPFEAQGPPGAAPKNGETHPSSSDSAAITCACFSKNGNGRIHRFLIHRQLSAGGFTPRGLLFPVSSVMLRDRRSYDQALQSYSDSVMPFIRYDLAPEGRMTVHNPTADLYRFWDATAFAEYLYSCVAQAIRTDLKEELGFLRVFDEAVRRAMDIVDMPDRRASLLVRLILQNGGRLSQSKRPVFAELTEAEIEKIEDAVRTA